MSWKIYIPALVIVIIAAVLLASQQQAANETNQNATPSPTATADPLSRSQAASAVPANGTVDKAAEAILYEMNSDNLTDEESLYSDTATDSKALTEIEQAINTQNNEL